MQALNSSRRSLHSCGKVLTSLVCKGFFFAAGMSTTSKLHCGGYVVRVGLSMQSSSHPPHSPLLSSTFSPCHNPKRTMVLTFASGSSSSVVSIKHASSFSEPDRQQLRLDCTKSSRHQHRVLGVSAVAKLGGLQGESCLDWSHHQQGLRGFRWH